MIIRHVDNTIFMWIKERLNYAEFIEISMNRLGSLECCYAWDIGKTDFTSSLITV